MLVKNITSLNLPQQISQLQQQNQQLTGQIQVLQHDMKTLNDPNFAANVSLDETQYLRGKGVDGIEEVYDITLGDEKSLLDITIDLGNPITYPSFFLGKIKPALSDRLKLKL